MTKPCLVAIGAVAVLILPACKPGRLPRFSGPAPSFKFVKHKEGGCANVILFKGTADDLEVLWIHADKEKLKLPAKGSVTFDLAAMPDGLQVGIDLWEKAPRFPAYCNDISADTKKRAIWKARKGKVTFTMFEAAKREGPGPANYQVSARLEKIVFEDDAGNQATLEEETISEATVGWYAG